MFDALRSAFRTTFTARALAIWLICTVVLAYTGPFGTFQSYAIWQTVPYWFLVACVSSLIGTASLALCSSYIAPERCLRIDLAATLVMTLIFSPLLFLLTQALLIQDLSAGPPFHAFFTYVAPVALAIYIGRRVLPGFSGTGYVRSDPAPSDAPPPRLRRRLPNDKDAPILRLSSKDHMVEVVTTSEVLMLRMRLSDAIEEMDGVPGHSTHRSHWVAHSAISGSLREGGKTFLLLGNGDRVPISRTYLPELEDKGVL